MGAGCLTNWTGFGESCLWVQVLVVLLVHGEIGDHTDVLMEGILQSCLCFVTRDSIGIGIG